MKRRKSCKAVDASTLYENIKQNISKIDLFRYWLNYWHTLLGEDTRVIMSNTVFACVRYAERLYNQHKVDHIDKTVFETER